MKITELLEALEPKKSNLPSAASLNDEPEDDVDNDAEDSDSDFSKGVDDFKRLGASFGPDLYSFSSISYHSGWDAKNSSDLAAKLHTIELDGIDSVANQMSSASGRDGGITFVIVNGRSGEAVAAGFGEDAISDGIQMDTLEDDQIDIVNRINALSAKYANVGGGIDEETNIGNKIRNQILVLLDYNNQPVKDIDPEADAARAEYEKMRSDSEKRNAVDPEYQRRLADVRKQELERREARRAKKRSATPAGREKR